MLLRPAQSVEWYGSEEMNALVLLLALLMFTQTSSYLSESTMGMSGAALPIGVTALCSNPVRRSDMSSGHNRMLKALVPRLPPAAFWAWYRHRFSFSAWSRAAYCCTRLQYWSQCW